MGGFNDSADGNPIVGCERNVSWQVNVHAHLPLGLSTQAIESARRDLFVADDE